MAILTQPLGVAAREGLGTSDVINSRIDKAVSWACAIAADDTHKYSQSIRWGPHYDCSSLVISAYEQAGVGVKTGGATYTGNMKNVFLKKGFVDVTSSVNLKTGAGLKKGDVLLNVVHHTALVQNSAAQTVEARGTDYGIVKNLKYRNYPWDCVLRYTGGGAASTASGVSIGSQGDNTATDDGSSSDSSDAAAATEKEYHFTDSNEKIPLHKTLFSQPNIIVTTDELRIIAAGTDGEPTDITRWTGPLEWTNSVDELATSATFTIAKPQETWQKHYTLALGDVVRLYTGGKEVFRGTVITVDDSSPIYNKYTCYDAGRMLNKSKDTYQFTDLSARQCLQKILGDLSVPVAYISDDGELDTATVSDVYIDKTISDIFKDIAENKLTGSYIFDFVPEGFRFYAAGEETAYPQFRVAPNTPLFDSVEYRGDETHQLSYDEGKTAVKVVSDTDVLASVREDGMYEKYGFVQEVVKFNDSDTDKDPYQFALDKLAELSGEKETYSFEIVESIDSYTRAGEALNVGDTKYLITNTDHSVENGVHKTKITIERM